MAYAAGKKAIGICDRCGFTYKLKDLKYEVQDQKKTGSRICPSCIDPDQPQYRVKKSKSKVNQAGNYTKPTMRKNLFNRIKAGGKGGKPGQWSARKAQMLAKQYKAKGGGYK